MIGKSKPVEVTDSELTEYVLQNTNDVFKIFLSEYMSNFGISKNDLINHLTWVSDYAIYAIADVKAPHKIWFGMKTEMTEAEDKGADVVLKMLFKQLYFGAVFNEPEKYPKTMKFLGYKHKQ